MSLCVSDNVKNEMFVRYRQQQKEEESGVREYKYR